MSNILLVEDYEELREELKDTLEEEGYQVYAVGSVFEALKVFKGQQVDLCLLDIGLPDGSGLDVCKQIRTTSNVPIIFLTAQTEEEHIVLGLKIGADDYISKPFRLGELLARIELQLRKALAEGEMNRLFCSGNLTFDFHKLQVQDAEKNIALTPIEVMITKMLLEQKGGSLTRECLLDHISIATDSFLEDNTLSVYVSRLKRKLGTFQGEEYIETIRGYGYRWSVPIYER